MPLSLHTQALMRSFLFILVLCFAAGCVSQPDSLQVVSPEGTLTVEFSLTETGAPTYSIQRGPQTVLEPSGMGFSLGQGIDMTEGFVIDQYATLPVVDETWPTVYGETDSIRNHYRELRIRLTDTTATPRQMDIFLRAYDDGVAFRYAWPEQEHLGPFQILDEHTSFSLPGDPTVWWIPAYGSFRYEYPYEETPLSAVRDTVHTPLTLRLDDDLYVALHEADLTDFASMTLVADSTTLRADLVPWHDGVKVRVDSLRETPWRMVQVGRRPGDLLASHLMLNLNDPNQIEDTSWIEPGRYIGIWWGMHLERYTWGQGPNHGATTTRTRRYIDFAAEHDFSGVLVEGWNVGWDGEWWRDGSNFDFTTPYPDFDLEGLAQYAQDRGTRLIGHHETGADIGNYEAQMEEAFALYERLGIRAVKTGYVGDFLIDADGNQQWHHGQFAVRHHQRVVETAAQHRVMINAHEPIKDTGLRRTWPNFMTREAAQGQEFNSPQSVDPHDVEHTTELAFTRMLAGPMDFTPGIVKMTYENPRTPENRVKTTLAKQLALYIVLYSPLHMAADLPEHYEAEPDAFRFIRTVPTDWSATHVVDGQIGDLAVVARRTRGQADWYLGAITDGSPRTLEVPLDFLEPATTYVAERWQDGEQAHWDTNPYALDVVEEQVTSQTVLRLDLAPGGGAAIHFRPVTDTP